MRKYVLFINELGQISDIPEDKNIFDGSLPITQDFGHKFEKDWGQTYANAELYAIRIIVLHYLDHEVEHFEINIGCNYFGAIAHMCVSVSAVLFLERLEYVDEILFGPFPVFFVISGKPNP